MNIARRSVHHAQAHVGTPQPHPNPKKTRLALATRRCFSTNHLHSSRPNNQNHRPNTPPPAKPPHMHLQGPIIRSANSTSTPTPASKQQFAFKRKLKAKQKSPAPTPEYHHITTQSYTPVLSDPFLPYATALSDIRFAHLATTPRTSCLNKYLHPSDSTRFSILGALAGEAGHAYGGVESGSASGAWKRRRALLGVLVSLLERDVGRRYGLAVGDDGYLAVSDLFKHPHFRSLDLVQLYQILEDDTAKRVVITFDSSRPGSSSPCENFGWWIRLRRLDDPMDTPRLVLTLPDAQTLPPLYYPTTMEDWELYKRKGIPVPRGGLLTLRTERKCAEVMKRPFLKSENVFISINVPHAMSALRVPFYVVPSTGEVLTPGDTSGLIVPEAFGEVEGVEIETRVLWFQGWEEEGGGAKGGGKVKEKSKLDKWVEEQRVEREEDKLNGRRGRLQRWKKAKESSASASSTSTSAADEQEGREGEQEGDDTPPLPSPMARHRARHKVVPGIPAKLPERLRSGLTALAPYLEFDKVPLDVLPESLLPWSLRPFDMGTVRKLDFCRPMADGSSEQGRWEVEKEKEKRKEQERRVGDGEVGVDMFYRWPHEREGSSDRALREEARKALGV